MIGDDMRPPAERLQDHGHLLVRRAIHRDDWIADALLDLAAGDQTEWTPAEWDALLTELGRDSSTISEFLVLYGE